MACLIDKLGRELLLGSVTWSLTAGAVPVQPPPTGTLTIYNLAGAAGSLPTGLSFPLSDAHNSGRNGTGQFIFGASTGWVSIGPTAPVPQGEVIVTLAAPGSLSFGIGVIDFAGGGLNGVITTGSYGTIWLERRRAGNWAGTILQGQGPTPVGLEWKMSVLGNRFALVVDGALRLAGTTDDLLPGGKFAFAHSEGSSDPAADLTVVSATFNTVPTMPAVTNLALQFFQVSTAMLSGNRVFQATSTTPTGNHNFQISGPGANYITVDVNTGLGVLALDHPPLGALAFTLTDYDSSASQALSFSPTIISGATLPGSAMTVNVAANLTNGLAPGADIATFSAPAGMSGTISYVLQLPPITIEGPAPRFSLDGVARKVTSSYRIEAHPQILTLVATNGTDVCATPFTVSAAAAVGPVLEVGPGQTYAVYPAATGVLFEDAVGPRNLAAGAKIRVHTKPGRRDYYGDFNGDNVSGAPDRGHAMAYGGYIEPYTIEGVPDPATGALPVIGGSAGYYGKGGVLLTENRDCGLFNVEAENVVIGPNNVAGIRDDGGRSGDTTISNYYGHNNHNAYLGTLRGKLTMNNILALMCGTGNSGFTHNWYMDGEEAEGHNILTSAVNGGHCWKDRSVSATYFDSVFDEGIMGRGSSAVDMPNGGSRRFYRCRFVKQSMANNVGLVQYQREAQVNVPGAPNYAGRNVGGILYFEDCDFTNLYHGQYGNGPAIAVWCCTNQGEIPRDPATGLDLQVVFVRCTQYGFTPDKFLVMGSGPGATAFPPGVSTLAEPLPLDHRSPLLAGTPVRAPSPWWHPNPQSYTVFSCNCEPGIIDPGVHEIRCVPGSPISTQLAQLKTWGHMDVVSSDPAFDPWGTGATYAQLSGGIPLNEFYDVSPGGVIHPKIVSTSAPVVTYMRVQVTNAAGDRKTDAIVPIITSNTPARTDCIPAALGPRVLPLGQEALA